MNTSAHDCQDLAATVPKSYIFLSILGIPSFEMLHVFCNSMSGSLDNDYTIQDLAFQVFKLFGVKNRNIRPFPRIMSFMTWFSKTEIRLKIRLNIRQPQFWNMMFFNNIWIPKLWTVTFFCNFMSPSLDNDCTIQDLAFQVLKLLEVNKFNVRPLPRIMSACPQVLIDNDYSRLGFPSLEMLLHGLFFGEHVLAWDEFHLWWISFVLCAWLCMLFM